MILLGKVIKVQKVVGLNKVVFSFAFVLFLFSLVSCGNITDTADFERYDPIFVDKFSMEDDIDSIHVSSLTAYYYEDRYYYVVEYIQDGDDFEYELLYILEYDGMYGFFSIKYPDECYQYVPNEYRAYLKAKDEGVKKVYTKKEIAEMINTFYGRDIVK